MYKGKVVCQGCQLSGADSPRERKDQLCQECQDVYLQGQYNKKEKAREYVRLYQHYHAFQDKEMNLFVHKFLETISNEHVKFAVMVDPVKHCFGSNRQCYRIPKSMYEVLKAFMLDLAKKKKDIEDAHNALPKLREDVQANERTKIYREGIERGKNLLLMLESGGISMQDFADNLENYHNTT